MTRDFTFDVYGELVDAGLEAGYEFITVREYLSVERLPEQFIIMRHDVDRKPENSLAMARLEAEKGISATYYVRTIEKTFKPDLIREIEDLGHEVGYHYEDMDRADGDVEAAHESFAEKLERLREHATVDTVCMHGNPLTSHDNRDMWDGTKDISTYGLLGEAYVSMDFTDVTYFSDTGRTWFDGRLKVKDTPIGASTKPVQINDTNSLVEFINDAGADRLCLLSHPNRWARTFPEYLIESGKDWVTNVGKHAIVTIR